MKRFVVVSLVALAAASSAFAQVTIMDPWVRATVPQQKATGAFMKITASKDARLVGAESPAAEVVEVHEMKMDGEVMKMRPLPNLDLPAGKVVELKPGGYHIMLIGLKQPVRAGESVTLTLLFESPDGKGESMTVTAPVRALTHAASPAKH